MRVHVTSTYNIVAHSTAQNSSDNLPSYPPNHHSSYVVYWKEGYIPWN